MCEPSTLLAVSIGLSAATSGLQIAQGRANQKAQTAYQQELVKANNRGVAEQQAALRQQEAQVAESNAVEQERARQTNQRAKSQALVAGSEVGAAGASFDAVLAEFDNQLSQYTSLARRQADLTKNQINYQIDALGTGAAMQSLQINSPVAGPNYGAALMNFAGDSLAAYRAYDPDAFEKTK